MPIELMPVDQYEGIRKIREILKHELNQVTSRIEISQGQSRNDADEILTLHLNDDEMVKLIIEYKNTVIPSNIKYMVNQLSRNKADEFIGDQAEVFTIIAAPKLSKEVQSILEMQGFGYVDFAGNMLVKCKGVYIRIEGKEIKLKRNESRSDLFKRSSVKSRFVLRTILENNEKPCYLVELAEAAGVSTGLTSKVLKQLVEKEWVLHSPEGYILKNPKELIRGWATEYNVKIAPKIEYYSMDSIVEIENKIQQFAKERSISYAFTGFSGAARISPSVRYNRVHVYIGEALDELAEYAGWKKGLSGSNITVLSIPDNQLLNMTRMIKDAEIVPISQLCLDLLGLPGRGEEAADAVMREAYKNYER